MKEIFSIVFVLVGALIGAGFASGQEIYSFFYCYGIYGILGIIITCLLIGFLLYKVLKIVYINEIDTYEEFLKLFIKNKKMIKGINFVLNILLIVSFYIMIAGFGAYFEQEIGIHKLIGSLTLVGLCFFVFLTNVKGVLKVSEYIVPFLILAIFVIGIKSIVNGINMGEFFNIPRIKNRWILSAIIYCSYNLILLIPVSISLRKHISKEDNIKYIAIFTNIVIMTLAIMIYIVLTKADIDIAALELPAVYIIRKFFTSFKTIYAFVILSSIFTTAISIGIGFLKNVSTNKKSYTQFLLFLCISSLLISNLGFSKLVNFSYPIFGYIGIAQIFAIFTVKLNKKYCKNKRL